MHYAKSEAEEYNVPGAVVHLYPNAPDAALSSAYVEVDGQYPETGRKKNTKCTEAIFLISGTLTVTIGDTTHDMQPHDVLYIPLNTPYKITGSGQAFVFITPEWDGQQSVDCAE